MLRKVYHSASERLADARALLWLEVSRRTTADVSTPLRCAQHDKRWEAGLLKVPHLTGGNGMRRLRMLEGTRSFIERQSAN